MEYCNFYSFLLKRQILISFFNFIVYGGLWVENKHPFIYFCPKLLYRIGISLIYMISICIFNFKNLFRYFSTNFYDLKYWFELICLIDLWSIIVGPFQRHDLSNFGETFIKWNMNTYKNIKENSHCDNITIIYSL